MKSTFLLYPYFFLSRYCQDSNLTVPTPLACAEHPVEQLGAVLLACLLKHSGLISMAMSEAPSLAEDLDHVLDNMPVALGNVIKVTHQVKTSLIKVWFSLDFKALFSFLPSPPPPPSPIPLPLRALLSPKQHPLLKHLCQFRMWIGPVRGA